MMTHRSLPLLALATLTVVGLANAGAGDTRDLGAFRVALDPENAYLPNSLVWKTGGDIELLDAKLGLNLTFTDFEFRNKFYRDENRNVWANQKDPRFVTEPQTAAAPAAATDVPDGFEGFTVGCTTSFAELRRTLLAHRTEPVVQIEYRLTLTRDMTIHEPDMLGVGVRFADGFTHKRLGDGQPDAAEGAVFSVEGKQGCEWALRLLNGGPAVVANAAANVAVLVSGTVAGDVPTPMPARLLKLTTGQSLVLTLTLRCVRGGPEALDAALHEALRQASEADRPYRLVENARLLMARKEWAKAEPLLVRAAELNREYATPYSLLAALRRDSGAPGAPSQTEAWVEAAYRVPYNYGYILSGSGFPGDKRLPEADRRQAIFNILVAVENTAFYPDYYIWAARPFEQMGMVVQACAMYRQALWALQYLPRTDEYKAKHRQQFEAKIAELEKHMLTEPAPVLPELIPVRAAD